jgi:hypothetical protein
MDEPERLLDQTGSALERALLREGRNYLGPEELRANTLAALGMAGSAGLATGGLLAWLSAKAWGTKVILTISAATVLTEIPVGYFMLRGPSTRGTAPALRPAPIPAPPAKSSAPATAAENVPPPTPAPEESAPVAVPTPARGSSGGSASALRAELAALDAVRSTLANGNSVGALSFLDAYFRTFPRGRLHPEAEVLRIDALAKGGRTDDARKYAQEFLRRHPNSVLAARVQSYAGR